MRVLGSLVCVVTCASASAWAAPLLYPPFEEGSGKTAADHSGNGADAEPVGSADWVERPGRGSAVELEEVAWGEMPHHDRFHLAESMTVACWGQFDGDFGDHQIAIGRDPCRAGGIRPTAGYRGQKAVPSQRPAGGVRRRTPRPRCP